MGQFLYTHTSNSLKATTVTISVFKYDPGYDYKLKYIPVLQYWTNFVHQLLTYLMNMNLTHIKKVDTFGNYLTM